MTSCRLATDAQISAFEKSIEALENNYKDFTASELENAVSFCDDQLKALENTDREFTPNQKERISNLKGRYHRLLVEIELYTLANDLFGGDSVIEYLRGLISGGKGTR